MSQVYHEIEKKILAELKTPLTTENLESATGLGPDQIRRGVEWLRLKNLVSVKTDTKNYLSLGKNGLDAFHNKLPERQLLDALKNGPKPIGELQKLRQFGPAMGVAKKNNWVSNKNGMISLNSPVNTIQGEAILTQIGTGKISQEMIADLITLESLKKRPDFITQKTSQTKTISKTKEPIKVLDGAIDVQAQVPLTHSAKIHPLNQTIQEIREIFVTLGFSEIQGDLAQSSFWNFDALFTPQDHPARGLQDTFYLDGVKAKKFATAQQIRNVSLSHKKGWRYLWSIDKAREMVLRTHTTCVTIKHLAEHKDEGRFFSMGRVFRNEKVSYKHLVEFNQIEGVVSGMNTTLRDLMGIQLEFYRRIGLNKVKFWPTFFPYTEPSLQTMVYNERLGKWVELFGMGIFRPEVTKPLGIDKPVLAWGGGIERIAMIKYGLDDVREFYNNDMGWLRESKCQ